MNLTSKRRRQRRIFVSETLEPKILLAGDLSANAIEANTADRVTNTEVISPDRSFLGISEDTAGGVGTILAGGVDGPSGELRELDVVHLGGTPNGRLGSYLVAGVGTGAAAQFSSWSVTQDSPAPTHLNDTDPIPGRDFKVHVLTPLENPELARRPFIISRVGPDDNLWLSSFHLSVAGNFVADDVRGFDQLEVISHAIAHRPGEDRAAWAQVVTPVIGRNPGGQLELRVVTWRVNEQTQQIQGLYASDPFDVTGLSDSQSELSIHHTGFSNYTINLKNNSNRVVTRYVSVGDEGQVFDAGGGASGRDYQGGFTSDWTDNLAAAPLNADASVAFTDLNGKQELTVWERRTDECFLFICKVAPYRLGSSDDDQNPNHPGITIDAPNLTHAYAPSPESNEFFGTSVAVGDFNGDGFNDVAAGASGQSINGQANAGAVTVLYGSENGIYNSPLNHTWSQDSPGITGVPDEGDRFGAALVAGDFDGDGKDDLAVGVPGESIEADGLAEVGVVQILYGSSEGITAAGDQLFRQGAGGVAGLSEAYDHFAASLAVGDFNNDGREDLAVGIPDEDHNQQGLVDAGAVHVFYGANGGLDGNGNDVTFHQNSPGFLSSAASGDQFGFALTAGDFNNDGNDDLAIGVPGKRAFGMSDTGAVHIVRGSGIGITANDQFITQDGIVANNNVSGGDISDATEAGDRFGEALAAGDFNADGFVDLAIAAPMEDANGFVNSGRVHALLGSNSGITRVGEEVFDQATPGVRSDPELGSRFGATLAAGDVDGDGPLDLLVGVPYQDHQETDQITYANTGIAVLIRGDHNSALTGFGGEMLKQGVNGIQNSPDPGDRFSAAALLADLNNDGFADAVIGVPNEKQSRFSSEYKNAGAVQMVDGGANGFTSDDVLWGQGLARHIRAMAANGNWEQQYGTGNGTLYELMPSGEPLAVHAASVTKATTLLVTVLALELPNSPIALTDQVTISERAADTGGSKMSGTQDGEDALLEEGDILTLESLMYGMMIHSGNRASVAIAEHVAMNVLNAGANQAMERFVDEMNDLGSLLNLDDTRYGHPAGGSVTTPQDLITMWRAGWQHPLFRQFSSSENSIEATTLNLDPPKIFQLDRTNGYVGQDGWKGGHGRVGDVYDEQGQLIEVPICTQCHVGQARRGGHTVVVGIQQSKEDMSNARELYDFSFQKLFTPDRRGRSAPPSGGPGGIVGPGPQMGDIHSLAVDHLTDSWIVTAAIDDAQHLQLITWAVNVNGGNLTPLGGAIDTVDNLPQGNEIASQATDMVRLPEGPRVQGDYVTASIESGNLRLDVWRVGAEVVDPPEPPGSNIGDFTDDQTVDVDDITRLCKEINAPRRNLAFDLNNDNRVDRGDLDTLVHDILETSYGDANLDGQFDSKDIVDVFVEARYLVPSRVPTTWDQGDWNCDGSFDQSDFVDAFTDGGYVGASPAKSASIVSDIGGVGAAIDHNDKPKLQWVTPAFQPRLQQLVERRAATLESLSRDRLFADDASLDDLGDPTNRAQEVAQVDLLLADLDVSTLRLLTKERPWPTE
ncbi:MAG: LEPR-XLL domain-containing protein [Planctomycetaceae bacterium]|nr:LEPR-XLL domain-containing protein [Planctomycetaceae bacterium]